MAVYALGDRVPVIDPTAFVHPEAVIIGDVVIGAQASVWPGAVLRGDRGRIVVGDRTSIQDGSVIHCTSEQDTLIGADCVVGHLVHMEGCVIHDGALVGSGSVVLPRAIVGAGALVAAGAVVPNDLEVPPGALARGVPARIVPDAAPQDVITASVEMYVANTAWYRQELRRLD